MSADTCAYLNTDLTSLLEYLTNKYDLDAENLSNITAGHEDHRPVYDDSIRDEATGELKNQLLSYNNSSIIQRMQYVYHGFVSIPKLDDGRAIFVLESSLDSDCAVKRFKPLWDDSEGCIYVSLSCYGSSVDVIKDLAKEFGGPIDEDDCDDEGYYYVSPVKDGQLYRVVLINPLLWGLIDTSEWAVVYSDSTLNDLENRISSLGLQQLD